MPKRASRSKPPAPPAAPPIEPTSGDLPAESVSYPTPTKASARAPRPRRVSEPATYNLYEAKTQLSDLVERAAAGETIVIAKAGVPMAHLTPLPAPEKPPLRKPGGWEGKVWIADDFDAPLPPEIQRYFDDPPIFPEEWEAIRKLEREEDEARRAAEGRAHGGPS